MRRMVQRRIRGSAAAVAAVAVLLSGCSNSTNGSESSSSSGGGGQIRILMSAPLTGASAETGKDMVDGANLAAEYLNGKGGVASGPLKGRQYVIEPADDQLQTQAATTIAARFAGDDGIFAMAGFETSGQAQAAGVVLKKYHLPLVVTFASADFLTKDADNNVVIAAAVSNYARAVTDFAAKDLKAKSVASIAGDYSFLDSYYKGLTDGTQTNSLTLTSKISYPQDTTDFSTLLTRISESSPDVILTAALQGDAGKIAAQMRRSGMKQPLMDYLGEGWGKTFADAAGSALSLGGYYQTDPADVFPAKGSLLSDMDSKFNKEFGKNISTPAMHGFDSILSIAAAIDAGATSKQDLLQYFPKAKGEGLLGPIDFTSELTPKQRVLSISKVTGPGPRDRSLVASYSVGADGSVRRR